jgi:carbonic anhydrase
MGQLERLLEGNDDHVASLAADHFASVRERQTPTVVSVSCSDSRVPTEGIWSAISNGDLFTGSNVGNQVWTDIDGERVLTDTVGYAVSSLDVDLAAVVGHTGCGAITAAYDASPETDDAGDSPAAAHAAVERLVPLVEAARSDGVVDADTPRREAINRLVEYAVREQVAFLAADASVPPDVTVAGFVYDFQAAYGGADGTAYLVSLDGVSDPDRLRERLEPAFHDHIRSQLPGN